MPKFLDIPSWYDATGAEVIGMGYTSTASRTAIGVPMHGATSAEGLSLISGTEGSGFTNGNFRTLYNSKIC